MQIVVIDEYDRFKHANIKTGYSPKNDTLSDATHVALIATAAKKVLAMSATFLRENIDPSKLYFAPWFFMAFVGVGIGVAAFCTTN